MKIILEAIKNIHILNAWIAIIPIWLFGIIISSTNRKGMKRGTDMSWYEKNEKISSFISLFSMISFMIVAVFIPIKMTKILFPLGILLIVVGALGHFAAKFAYASTEMDKPASSGVYRISRNPMYAFLSLVFLGTSIISISPVLFSIWIVLVISSHVLIMGEELYCQTKYGQPYLEYMARVSRYFGFRNQKFKKEKE
jgi:protein-S-isoprenylcysteine O-methyltransferase Ste14